MVVYVIDVWYVLSECFLVYCLVVLKYERIKILLEFICMKARGSAVALMADRTAYDVRYGYRPLSQIGMISTSTDRVNRDKNGEAVHRVTNW